MTHFQVSKYNEQLQGDKNSLDQKNVDFRGCECCIPCVKDGLIDSISYYNISLTYTECGSPIWIVASVIYRVIQKKTHP